MLRNQKQKLYHAQALAPQTVTGTVQGSAISTEDIRSLGFLLAVGTFAFSGSNYLTVSIEESDDGSSWAAGDMYSALVLDDPAKDEMSHLVEYRGNKKYARLVLTETGSVNVTVSAVAVSMHPEFQAPL